MTSKFNHHAGKGTRVNTQYVEVHLKGKAISVSESGIQSRLALVSESARPLRFVLVLSPLHVRVHLLE